MYLIGIDLGTTGCKSMVFDDHGTILSQSYIEYSIMKDEEGYIEQDAGLWWTLVKQSVSESVATSGVNVHDIKALSISSQGISFVPVDAEGNTLYNAISWLDARPVEQTDRIRGLFGDLVVFKRTGKRISPNYTLPKLIWLKENKPEIYQKTDKFLMALDYITFKLTGKAVTDYSMASGTMAFNITTKCWDEEMIRICGLDADKLPEVYCAGSLVGVLDPDVAAEIGLPQGVKVVLGAQDQKCAAIGAGIGQGIATVSLGTATAVSSIGIKPVFDLDMRIPCFTLDENRWIMESVIGTSCISLKWMKTTLFEHMEYAEMDRIAESSVPGANGLFFYPHMEGASTPYWRNDIKGFMYGLSLSTSRGDMVRALLEGIGFQIRANIEVHEEINGDSIDEIRIFGGGSNSELWCRLIADITGKTVSTLYTSEIANLGAVILAGTGIGIFRDSEEVLSRIQLIKKQWKPDQYVMEKYSKVFAGYLEIQSKIFS